MAIVDDIARWRNNSALMMEELYNVTLDDWQKDAFKLYDENEMVALQASKGPGKTFVLAGCGTHMMLCYSHPNVGAISITEDNLRDNLWKELALWTNRSDLTRKTFKHIGKKFFHKKYPKTWFITARQFSKDADVMQQGLALAGLHADYIGFLIDESGEIPQAVVATAEAVLSSCKRGRLIQAGNTTSKKGALYAAYRDDHWKNLSINSDPKNPKRAKRVSVQWAQQQIDRYGRDHPWVKINVLGEYPDQTFRQLVGEDALERLLLAKPLGNTFGDTILGVDVGRGGDPTIVVGRRGRELVAYKEIIETNGSEITSKVISVASRLGAKDICVDDTGGYGGSVVDHLSNRGVMPTVVKFNGAALSSKYLNRRAEIIWKAAEWVRGFCCYNPKIEMDIDRFHTNLAQQFKVIEYFYKNDKIAMPDKEQIRDALSGRSTDELDALALTFALGELDIIDTGDRSRTQYSDPLGFELDYGDI